MCSLADLPELVGFFSYSRDDDEAFRGALTALRDGVARELGAQLGRNKRTFRLWQDREAIAPGKLWESEIRAAVGQSVFFIPIITPRVVNSHYCQLEFSSFLEREKGLDRSDLVFPILYITVPALIDEARWRNDPVLSIVGTRQYIDWRPMRQMDPHTPIVREAIERFCEKIVEALQAPWVSPEERWVLAEAARLWAEEEAERQRSEAEEARKRLEHEAGTVAEEEAGRKAEAAEAERRQREANEIERSAHEERERSTATAEAHEAEQRRVAKEAEASRLADERTRLGADPRAPRASTPAPIYLVRDAAAPPQKKRSGSGIGMAGIGILVFAAIAILAVIVASDLIGHNQLCRGALNADLSNWDTLPGYAASVTEAKRLGFTVETCRAEVKTR
jgi:hypothetical protein